MVKFHKDASQKFSISDVLLVDMAPKKMPKTMARIKDPIARARVKKETIEKLSKNLKIGCPKMINLSWGVLLILRNG